MCNHFNIRGYMTFLGYYNVAPAITEARCWPAKLAPRKHWQLTLHVTTAGVWVRAEETLTVQCNSGIFHIIQAQKLNSINLINMMYDLLLCQG